MWAQSINTLANSIHLDTLTIEQILLYSVELDDGEIEPRVGEVLSASIRRLSLPIVLQLPKRHPAVDGRNSAEFSTAGLIGILTVYPPSSCLYEQVKADWKWYISSSRGGTIRLYLFAPRGQSGERG